MSQLLEKQSEDLKTKPPSRVNVIFHNDDFTDINFVIEVLVDIFKKDTEAAITITLAIHEKGIAIVGQYAKDIAETRQHLCTKYARQEGFPLRVTIEPT